MCLAIPGKIKSIELQYDGALRMAKINFGGITKEASLEMLPDANIGDYVLVHVGVAISIVNEEEAQKTFKYLKEIGELGDLTDVDDYLPKGTKSGEISLDEVNINKD
jgi:hydrogenase expression/formation protein HypC